MIFEDHKQWPNKDIKIKRGKTEEILTPNQQLDLLEKKLMDAVGNRFPVVVKFHPSKVKKVIDPDSPGQFRIEQPPGAPITLEWTANGLDGLPHVYTWCEYYEPDPVTKKNRYVPTIINLKGGYKEFQQKDKEFLMWLFLAFPNLQGGMNETKSPNIIVFDTPHLEKKEEADMDALLTQVMVQINDRKLGLSMADLKKMLSSYFVPGVEKMEDYEVINKMKSIATAGFTRKDKMETMRLFLDRCDNQEGIRVRFTCQKAIEAGYLVFESKRGAWYLTQDGKPVDPPIAVVKPNERSQKEQILFEIMAATRMKDVELLEVALGLVEEKKPKGKGKKSDEEEE